MCDPDREQFLVRRHAEVDLNMEKKNPGKSPVIRVFLRWKGEGKGTDAARGIRGLNQAHCIGDSAGTAST